MTCNQCCYSSMGRFEGVARLHCGLAGCALTEMPAECGYGRRADAAAERYSFWRESETDDSVRSHTPSPR